ncbi:MAG: SAM-dependent DNA methyltransferase [Elusimicrobia bacterium]|nr:SAM-dependent DNA methyltransferase [Elusimicrobiota bacterium]
MIASKKIEFGDFQTPSNLAREIAAFLRDNGETPDVIVEPTCGRGSFVGAAIAAFPKARAIYGFDINPQHVREAEDAACRDGGRKAHLECRNFFHVDWGQFFSTLGGTVLVIGNPPWVTNSALGSLGSDNLPKKTNFQGRKGFAAKTGKANFDISEWMLLRHLDALHRRAGCVAMLCKTAIARKALRHAWLNRLNVGRCSLHLIDAQRHFGASVDACLLIVHTGMPGSTAAACVYPDLSFNGRITTIGLAGKELVADIDEYLRLRDIDGIPYYTWRSGVKHDAAAVMEFRHENGHFTNGQQEECRFETTYLFPLLKSSDIANGRMTPVKYILVTQRKPSDDTAEVKKIAPKTWTYLTAHAGVLDQRRSIIYQKRPRFSVFGVGDYTFSPWKVAISGLYKNCRFDVAGEHHGKPIVLDDTCYFIPCASEKEARFVCELLNSDVCQRFLRSLAFFDAKRPITIDILNRIDLRRVAEHVNRATEARRFLSAAAGEDKQPLLVFEKKAEYRTKGSSARRVPRRR